MIDGPGLAIRDRENICGVGTGINRAHYPRSCYHQYAHSSADSDGIMKRKANGHITIVSHRGQKQSFCTCHSQEEEALNPTSSDGDRLVCKQKIIGHFGNSGRDVVQIHEGELAKQKIMPDPLVCHRGNRNLLNESIFIFSNPLIIPSCHPALYPLK